MIKILNKKGKRFLTIFEKSPKTIDFFAILIL